MSTTLGLSWRDARYTTLGVAARPLHALIAAPSLVYLGALAVMLFRPPDLDCCLADRVAFGILVCAVVLRAMLLRQAILPKTRLLWPMGGLAILVLADLLARPFEIQMWSVAAAKFLVPYALFCLAGLAFADAKARRRLEVFALVVLGYLIWIALAKLARLDFLIFPKFILDPGIGIHAERARGPFLQAEANGATLNLLGLIAVDAYGRGKLRGIWAALLLAGLPLALLATKTRAAWLGFGLSLAALFFMTRNPRVRKTCAGLVVAGVAALLLAITTSSGADGSMRGRLDDANTVEFRLAAYETVWQIFQDRPFIGWGGSPTQLELADRIRGFHGRAIAVHNTYLEILVDYGLLGFGLYAWLVAGLIRLGRRADRRVTAQPENFLEDSVPVWPLLLCVYFWSGTFVVMNYQFVNGLLFTIAGILARGNLRAQPTRERFSAGAAWE